MPRAGGHHGGQHRSCRKHCGRVLLCSARNDSMVKKITESVYSCGGRGEAINVGSDSQVDLFKRKAHFGQRLTQECDFREWIKLKWAAEAVWSVLQCACLMGGGEHWTRCWEPHMSP